MPKEHSNWTKMMDPNTPMDECIRQMHLLADEAGGPQYPVVPPTKPLGPPTPPAPPPTEEETAMRERWQEYVHERLGRPDPDVDSSGAWLVPFMWLIAVVV